MSDDRIAAVDDPIFHDVASALLEKQIEPKEGEKITPGANLELDLYGDSLDLAEAIITLENKFKIEFGVDETDKITTVGDIVEIIRRHLGEAAA